MPYRNKDDRNRAQRERRILKGPPAHVPRTALAVQVVPPVPSRIPRHIPAVGSPEAILAHRCKTEGEIEITPEVLAITDAMRECIEEIKATKQAMEDHMIAVGRPLTWEQGQEFDRLGRELVALRFDRDLMLNPANGAENLAKIKALLSTYKEERQRWHVAEAKRLREQDGIG